MESIVSYTREQYQYVKGSRNVLFEYCETISAEDFVNQNSSFGRGGSIRNLLVHIANTYEYWIANFALKKNRIYAEYENYKTIKEVKLLFEIVDDFMEEFISQIDQIKDFEIQNTQNTAKPLQLFSHVITHEYHHKGQILSLSRHLGYTPVDTDIMR
ncbi:DinB family protein [Flavobacterium sp.]|uniref:DinB family protein n=1 Tax=Flavobacterium sp. TaxID=239 RepID=UPI0031CDC93E